MIHDYYVLFALGLAGGGWYVARRIESMAKYRGSYPSSGEDYDRGDDLIWQENREQDAADARDAEDRHELRQREKCRFCYHERREHWGTDPGDRSVKDGCTVDRCACLGFNVGSRRDPVRKEAADG